MQGPSGMKKGKNRHLCLRTAHWPSPAGTEVPQRVKARKKNLSEPVRILSDLWLGSVHSVLCEWTAALQFNPSLFFAGHGEMKGLHQGQGVTPWTHPRVMSASCTLSRDQLLQHCIPAWVWFLAAHGFAFHLLKAAGEQQWVYKPRGNCPPSFESLAEDSSCNHGRMRGNQSPA